MSLQDEIEAGRQTIKTESLSMSIGELVNLYRDQEVVIRPEFQRLFRWNSNQKSRLIESILLGIPLPSIFVMQRLDGVWELIDGLQRISTILEFMGELRSNDDARLQPPKPTHATTYLKSLEGVVYESEDENQPSLTPGQRLSLKRAKLDVKILLPETDNTAKYELFDRLNAGGSRATSQEVRSAQIIMRDGTMFTWLESLRSNPNFDTVLSISDRLYDESYDMELVCRFIVLNNSTEEQFRSIDSIDDYISKRIYEITTDSNFDREGSRKNFEGTFRAIADALEDDAFRRYDSKKVRFLGGFSVSAFESITVGVARNLDYWSNESSHILRERVEELWNLQEFKAGSAGGVRASTRINKTLPAAIQFFDEQ
jgi:hypothetical protein